MKKDFKITKILIWGIAMLLLVTNTQAAIQGASLGLETCIKAVIPALFPFFVLSTLLANALSRESIPAFAPLGRLCTIPKGQECLFLLGLLCGYPVGAQNIYTAYSTGNLDRRTARRLTGFCSNAGPSFIFGVTSMLFRQRYVPWVLWAIQIFSAMAVGILLPGRKEYTASSFKPKGITPSEALSRSLNALANVCGWVILFRVMIELLSKQIFPLIPEVCAVIVIGLLELTNGCIALQRVSNDGLRFVICSGFLSFGGLCILTQTMSIVKELGVKKYIHGKLLQGAISILCATLLQTILFRSDAGRPLFSGILICSASVFCIILFLCCRKKEVAFSDKTMYNEKNAA